MGFIKRRANSKDKIVWRTLRRRRRASCKTSLELVLNWGRAGISVVSASSWIMEMRGLMRVEIGGLDDKWQSIEVFAELLVGDFSIRYDSFGSTHRGL